MGSFPLLGPDRHTWDVSNNRLEQDLVQLYHREGFDRFS